MPRRACKIRLQIVCTVRCATSTHYIHCFSLCRADRPWLSGKKGNARRSSLQLTAFVAVRFSMRIAHGSPGKKATFTAFTPSLAAMVGDLSTKLEALPKSMIWRAGLMQHSLRSFLRLRLRCPACLARENEQQTGFSLLERKRWWLTAPFCLIRLQANKKRAAFVAVRFVANTYLDSGACCFYIVYHRVTCSDSSAAALCLSVVSTDDLSSEGISGSVLQSRRNIRRLRCMASMQVSWLTGHRRLSAFPEFITPVTLLKIRSLLTVAVPHRIFTGFPFHLPAGQSNISALRHMKACPIDF